jgi:hypothetical protein
LHACPPALGWNVPAVHDRQNIWPVLGCTVPGLHIWQGSWPVLEYWPTGQDCAAAAP